MTGRNTSASFKQAVNAEQTSEVFIGLVTITHPDWTDDVRVSSDPTQILPDAGVRGTVSNGLEYLFAPFNITLPSQDDSGVARAQITVDNISRELMQKIRQATSAVNISFVIVLSSTPDDAEVTVSDFKLQRVSYDAFTISGEISVEYFDLEPFPRQRYTPSKYPAIF